MITRVDQQALIGAISDAVDLCEDQGETAEITLVFGKDETRLFLKNGQRHGGAIVVSARNIHGAVIGEPSESAAIHKFAELINFKVRFASQVAQDLPRLEGWKNAILAGECFCPKCGSAGDPYVINEGYATNAECLECHFMWRFD